MKIKIKNFHIFFYAFYINNENNVEKSNTIISEIEERWQNDRKILYISN